MNGKRKPRLLWMALSHQPHKRVIPKKIPFEAFYVKNYSAAADNTAHEATYFWYNGTPDELSFTNTARRLRLITIHYKVPTCPVLDYGDLLLSSDSYGQRGNVSHYVDFLIEGRRLGQKIYRLSRPPYSSQWKPLLWQLANET